VSNHGGSVTIERSEVVAIFLHPTFQFELNPPLAIAASFAFVSLPATAPTYRQDLLERFGGNLSGSPTAMAFAPDGRLLVYQQGGRLRDQNPDLRRLAKRQTRAGFSALPGS